MASPLAANLDIERFIQDIQDRPCIWDRNYHCNKGFMEQTWTDLSKLHELPSTMTHLFILIALKKNLTLYLLYLQ
jgi:hypothetical protein